MTALSDDERAVLNVFAGAIEPLDWCDVVESLLPPRPRGPRRGGKRAWKLRWEEMVGAAMSLYKAGLLEELPNGPADMTVITDKGREAVESVPTGLIVIDALLLRHRLVEEIVTEIDPLVNVAGGPGWVNAVVGQSRDPFAAQTLNPFVTRPSRSV